MGFQCVRACLKNHSYNLHAPICGIFCLHSVDVARYAALIQAKSPTNCNAHLQKAFFKHALDFKQIDVIIMLSSAIFIKSNLKCRFLHFTITYGQVKSYLLSPNPLPLFNSSSPATVQKPLPPIRHICGLGASVG